MHIEQARAQGTDIVCLFLCKYEPVSFNFLFQWQFIKVGETSGGWKSLFLNYQMGRDITQRKKKRDRQSIWIIHQWIISLDGSHYQKFHSSGSFVQPIATICLISLHQIFNEKGKHSFVKSFSVFQTLGWAARPALWVHPRLRAKKDPVLTHTLLLSNEMLHNFKAGIFHLCFLTWPWESSN